VVDPSLMGLAADRGVTICFADLDGAEGLWVPEERTVLVSRRLSEQEIAAVIEHELEHVAIDDGHADLDAATRRPRARSTYWPAALTAAACLALVGGITAGLMGQSRGDVRQEPVVAPSRPGLTGSAPAPSPVVPTVVRTTGPDGLPTTRTISVTPTGAAPPPVPRRPASPAATGSAAPTTATSGPPATTAAPQPSASTTPEPTPSTTVPPTTENPLPSASPSTTAQTESAAADTDSGKTGKTGKSGRSGGS
jgi:hypothetical protein